MDITTITTSQWFIIAATILAGIILGSLLVPKPVKGGFLSVLLGGVIGAAVGALGAYYMITPNLLAQDLRVVGMFFAGALVGVILVKIILQERRQFRTETN